MSTFFLAILTHTPSHAAWLSASHSSHASEEAKKIVRRPSLELTGSGYPGVRAESRIRGVSGCRRRRIGCAHLADPIVELLPAVIEPCDQLVAVARHVGCGEAPELQPDGRTHEAAGPDVADVLKAIQAEVAEYHH